MTYNNVDKLSERQQKRSTEEEKKRKVLRQK